MVKKRGLTNTVVVGQITLRFDVTLKDPNFFSLILSISLSLPNNTSSFDKVYLWTEGNTFPFRNSF